MVTLLKISFICEICTSAIMYNRKKKKEEEKKEISKFEEVYPFIIYVMNSADPPAHRRPPARLQFLSFPVKKSIKIGRAFFCLPSFPAKERKRAPMM